MNIEHTLAGEGKASGTNSTELGCSPSNEGIESYLCPIVWGDKLQPKEFVDWARFYHKLEYYMMSQQARIKSHPIVDYNL